MNAETQVKSLCTQYSTSSGPAQKIISYTYFEGEFSKSMSYENFLGNIATLTKRAKEFYPGWVIRLHMMRSLYYDTSYYPMLCNLTCENINIDICILDELDNEDYDGFSKVQKNGRFWRYLPLLDELVDVFISRDVDSEILDREASAVDDWLKSNLSYHIIRDHPRHCWAAYPILAGLFGAKIGQVRSKHLPMWKDYVYSKVDQRKQQDQYQLKTKIYDVVKSDLMEHDSYCCEMFEAAVKLPFKIKRNEKGDFCGGGRRWESSVKEILDEPCPEKCRPINHPNWTYC